MVVKNKLIVTIECEDLFSQVQLLTRIKNLSKILKFDYKIDYKKENGS